VSAVHLSQTTTNEKVQNEYAQILHKRINEAKSAHDEAKKRRASSMKH
jgi:small subunit ribosomal protein S6e